MKKINGCNTFLILPAFQCNKIVRARKKIEKLVEELYLPAHFTIVTNNTIRITT